MCVCLDLCESLANKPDHVRERGQRESRLAVILVRNIMRDGGWRSDRIDTDSSKNEKVAMTLIFV